MKPTVELYECLTDGLKTTNKRGRVNNFAWISKIGNVWKVHPSEKAAHNYLVKNGYVLDDFLEWVAKYKSENQLFVENHYRKV